MKKLIKVYVIAARKSMHIFGKEEKMGKTHWKKLNNPDYLGAYALEPGEDMALTIKKAGQEAFTGTSGKKEEGLLIHFMEDVKPMICNATNAKTISKLAGSPYVEDWGNVRIALFSQEVSAFGETVDALRVRPYPPKAEECICQECGAKIEGFKTYTPRQMAERAKSKYGRYLCMECATKAKEAAEQEDLLDENDEG